MARDLERKREYMKMYYQKNKDNIRKKKELRDSNSAAVPNSCLVPDSCLLCGKSKGRNKYFCSKKCEADYKQNRKICVVCGKSFPCPPSETVTCCSDKCRNIRRKSLHESGAYDEVQELFREGLTGFLEKYSGEKSVNSKQWVIQSPSGKMYECQNLLYFIRQNPDLFDGSPRQAFDGIVKIKASYQGKRKKPSYTWKGWRLISWNDERLGKT